MAMTMNSPMRRELSHTNFFHHFTDSSLIVKTCFHFFFNEREEEEEASMEEGRWKALSSPAVDAVAKRREDEKASQY